MPAPRFTSIDRTGHRDDLLTTEECASLLGWTRDYLRVARSGEFIKLEPAAQRGTRVFFARGDVLDAADALTEARTRVECAIPGCGRAARVSRDGLCTGHVAVVRARGTRDGLQGPPPRLRGLSTAERIAALSRRDADGCDLWCGPTTNGYGRLSVDGRNRRAHVVAFELAMGRTVRAGMELDHECEQKMCVRVGPGHVVEATHAENIARRSASYFARKAAEQAAAAAEQQTLATVTRLWYTPHVDPAEYQQAA